MIKDIEKNRIKLEDLIPKKLTPVDAETLEKFKKENPAEYSRLKKEANERVEHET